MNEKNELKNVKIKTIKKPIYENLNDLKLMFIKGGKIIKDKLTPKKMMNKNQIAYSQKILKNSQNIFEYNNKDNRINKFQIEENNINENIIIDNEDYEEEETDDLNKKELEQNENNNYYEKIKDIHKKSPYVNEIISIKNNKFDENDVIHMCLLMGMKIDFDGILFIPIIRKIQISLLNKIIIKMKFENRICFLDEIYLYIISEHLKEIEYIINLKMISRILNYVFFIFILEIYCK